MQHIKHSSILNISDKIPFPNFLREIFERSLEAKFHGASIKNRINKNGSDGIKETGENDNEKKYC